MATKASRTRWQLGGSALDGGVVRGGGGCESCPLTNDVGGATPDACCGCGCDGGGCTFDAGAAAPVRESIRRPRAAPPLIRGGSGLAFGTVPAATDGRLATPARFAASTSELTGGALRLSARCIGGTIRAAAGTVCAGCRCRYRCHRSTGTGTGALPVPVVPACKVWSVSEPLSHHTSLTPLSLATPLSLTHGCVTCSGTLGGSGRHMRHMATCVTGCPGVQQAATSLREARQL